MLTVLEQIPEGLLECKADELHGVLPGPSLIHLPGKRPEPLFVSVLLHGNEPTGLYAAQRLLRKYQGQTLPRALSLFIGNVSAAQNGQRHREGQPDYNRVWPHAGQESSAPGKESSTAEHAMMQEIVDIMRKRKVFASIDVHNNTGLNPHYGCVNKLEQDYLHLATLFSRTVVYFIRPQGVQSMAFAEICPAVTVECGKPDHEYGVEHALEFLDTALRLSHFPEHPVPQHDIDVFHTVATVYVPDEVSIGFGNEAADISFLEDLDHLNFRELPVGTSLGISNRSDIDSPLTVINEEGNEVTEQYFRLDEGEIRTTMPVMPSMFTLNAEVIQQDCVGYLMERIDLARFIPAEASPHS